MESLRMLKIYLDEKSKGACFCQYPNIARQISGTSGEKTEAGGFMGKKGYVRREDGYDNIAISLFLKSRFF